MLMVVCIYVVMVLGVLVVVGVGYMCFFSFSEVTTTFYHVTSSLCCYIGIYGSYCIDHHDLPLCFKTSLANLIYSHHRRFVISFSNNINNNYACLAFGNIDIKNIDIQPVRTRRYC